MSKKKILPVKRVIVPRIKNATLVKPQEYDITYLCNGEALPLLVNMLIEERPEIIKLSLLSTDLNNSKHRTFRKCYVDEYIYVVIDNKEGEETTYKLAKSNFTGNLLLVNESRNAYLTIIGIWTKDENS